MYVYRGELERIEAAGARFCWAFVQISKTPKVSGLGSVERWQKRLEIGTAIFELS